MNTRIWQADRFEAALDRPKVMGIVNLAPDSLPNSGTYSQNISMALAHAGQLLENGADILDIDGESTRPGSDGIFLGEKWAKVQQVLAGTVK